MGVCFNCGESTPYEVLLQITKRRQKFKGICCDCAFKLFELDLLYECGLIENILTQDQYEELKRKALQQLGL